MDSEDSVSILSEVSKVLVNFILKFAVVVLELAVRVEVTQVAFWLDWVNFGCVLSMLNFHASEPAQVNIITHCLVFFHVEHYSHLHIEGLVGLCLAV